MPPTYIHYLLIPHPSQQRLLVSEDSTPTLPRYDTAEPHYWQMVAPVNQLAHDHLGVRLTTLRAFKVEAANNGLGLFYAMDSSALPPDWQPPVGMQWMSEAAIDELPPEQQPVVREWLAWKAQPDAIQTEWYRPGWYAQTARWMEDRFDERGILMTTPIEQLRSWERSAILRAQTSFGQIYFKALPPMFRHEAPLVKWLAHNYPNDFPKPIVVDGWRRWLLMPDYGTQTLDKVRDIDQWEAALRHLAELQISISVRLNELIGLGCPDRRLYHLAAAIEPLLMSSASALSGDNLQLSDDQLEALRARIPAYKQACIDLTAYGIPASLEHGDFWGGQIVVSSRKPIFIDWSDSSISHPFFSLYFLHDADIELPDVLDVRERLRDAYLQPWRAYEPLDKLIQAYELAMRLAPLHHALIYHQHILPHMQNRWEMQNMMAFYLRNLR